MASIPAGNRYVVPPDFHSDGCTVPRLLHWYFAKYKDDCRWHDWARRHLVYYSVITVQQADTELHRRWIARGMPRWMARLSWLVGKMMRDKYSATMPVPNKNWLEFVYPN